ncbi:hypothetical protein CEXT_316301 [Caerostris extrusa]|uniref:Uncharacterized protein n=1 Tax=Caerostris extrusa TaxID=172846 RepID=A0AAV4VMB5_CAEEX|nr:hypothetical protein CEXT_316301 [Caerostris extrusa]
MAHWIILLISDREKKTFFPTHLQPSKGTLSSPKVNALTTKLYLNKADPQNKAKSTRPKEDIQGDEFARRCFIEFLCRKNAPSGIYLVAELQPSGSLTEKVIFPLLQ